MCRSAGQPGSDAFQVPVPSRHLRASVSFAWASSTARAAGSDSGAPRSVGRPRYASMSRKRKMPSRQSLLASVLQTASQLYKWLSLSLTLGSNLPQPWAGAPPTSSSTATILRQGNPHSTKSAHTNTSLREKTPSPPPAVVLEQRHLVPALPSHAPRLPRLQVLEGLPCIRIQ